MSSLIEELIKGRKTFFIAPDKSLFPESYLEEYLSQGYECYFVETDRFLPIATKIDILLSVFKDAVLFFNIDAVLPTNEKWITVIANAQHKYPNAVFGVIYAKRQTQHEKASLEQLYLMDIGIKGGCIQLEYQKKNNFGIVEKGLFANQAMGRRKNVRACCSSSCTIQFHTKNGDVISARLNDISISHFSFTVNLKTEIEISEYEKIVDAQFVIKGCHFSADAVLFIVRETDYGRMYIFAFSTKSGQPGLDPINRQMLVPKIHSIMNDNCQELLTRLFKSAMDSKATKSSYNIDDLTGV